MKSFAQMDLDNRGEYLELLSAIAKISRLFSDSDIPLINYRVAENIFCKSFGAINLSRSDTAFDANLNHIGIGLKTFTCQTESSIEKVAEFNKLSPQLAHLKGMELAIKIAELRNERINVAMRLYDIHNTLYHIVARREKELILFETDYNAINVDKIEIIKDEDKSIKFHDNHNQYTFNRSKSTLYRKFYVPNNSYHHPIDIIENPYQILLQLLEEKALSTNHTELQYESVVLPLYRTRGEKEVPQKSGLNQWNAGGRKRDIDEIYIPIPKRIHQINANFFPNRDTPFQLKIPSGEIFSAKVCQDNSKALMTNPNNALSHWLLRTILQVKEGELLTMQKLNTMGFDSVVITKINQHLFTIDVAPLDSYEKFVGTHIPKH